MAGLPIIEIVKRQALATFSKMTSGVNTNFEENLTTLKGLMNKITSSDVNLDQNLLNPAPKGMEEFHAPVTYIEVMNDPNVTIGIFVLKQGARLPLHDHPLMYGILKVIHGSIHLQSYSIVPSLTEKNEKPLEKSLSDVVHPSDINLSRETLNYPISLTAVKEPALTISDTDNVCVLSPITGNLHEIHTVDGPAAFLDVLSPPYDTDIPGIGPRPCRYFVEVKDVKENDQDKSPLKKLLRIRSPPDYWSSSAPYQGP